MGGHSSRTAPPVALPHQEVVNLHASAGRVDRPAGYLAAANAAARLSQKCETGQVKMQLAWQHAFQLQKGASRNLWEVHGSFTAEVSCTLSVHYHCKERFEVDVRGQTVMMHTLETSTEFYHQVFASGNATVFLLRFICCTWVFSQVYLQEFRSVRALLRYHDFSRWFLPLKGEEVRNSWAICIPIIQYMVLQCITIVSFLVICAFDEPFDIVMNSLAFTFIAEVGSVFNDPLVHRMANTCIKDLPEGYPVIKYLYPEYQLSNAVNDDGTYTDGGWYICEEEEKAGLLSDYRVRHNEAAYPQQHQRAKFLEILIFALPAFCIFLGAWHSHCREEPNAKECHLERLRFLRLDL